MLMFYLAMLETEEEQATFEEIYEEFRYGCLHVALIITKNLAMAEDAVHNAFLSVIRHKKKYFQMPRFKLKSQIIIITKNKAIDLLRGEKQMASTPVDEFFDDTVADDFDVPEFVISEESYKHLVACVSRLPEKYRIVFQLRYMHDLSNKEIAERLDKSQQTVATMLHRGKAALGKLLLAEGVLDE